MSKNSNILIIDFANIYYKCNFDIGFVKYKIHANYFAEFCKGLMVLFVINRADDEKNGYLSQIKKMEWGFLYDVFKWNGDVPKKNGDDLICIYLAGYHTKVNRMRNVHLYTHDQFRTEKEITELYKVSYISCISHHVITTSFWNTEIDEMLKGTIIFRD